MADDIVIVIVWGTNELWKFALYRYVRDVRAPSMLSKKGICSVLQVYQMIGYVLYVVLLDTSLSKTVFADKLKKNLSLTFG